jgi:hypothetical protein
MHEETERLITEARRIREQSQQLRLQAELNCTRAQQLRDGWQDPETKTAPGRK